MSRPALSARRVWRCLALSAALLAVLVVLLPERAGARPGGGHTYSGGSRSHAGGGSSGGGRSGSAFRPTPPIGGGGGRGIAGPIGGGLAGCGGMGCFFLVLLLAVLILVIYLAMKARAGGSPPPPPDLPPSLELDAIRGLDPELSVVLFEDFVYALYAKAHEARPNRAELEALSPYLSEQARAELAGRPPVGAPVAGVVIGAMRVAELAMPMAGEARPQVKVTLEFESNMTVGAAGAQITQYVRERWRLVRDAGVRSKPPEAVRTFHCPNCGAPFGPASGDRCEYCGEVVSGGRFDWSVVSIEALEIEDRPPSLTGTAREAGGDLPTIFHPAVQARRAELLQADPASGDDALVARLQLIYQELNAAWSALDLAPARSYVSDGLFDYLQYWITAYRQQGLRNVLEGMRLTRWTLAKVIRDQHFDSLTFRIWGTGRDYTVRQADGAVLGGDPRTDRDYSEYWTLIRGAGVRGAPRTDKSCPNCGAPLDVNMAGRCQHCDAKITSGDFDWVLSKIEQDDSYTG